MLTRKVPAKDYTDKLASNSKVLPASVINDMFESQRLRYTLRQLPKPQPQVKLVSERQAA